MILYYFILQNLVLSQILVPIIYSNIDELFCFFDIFYTKYAYGKVTMIAS